MLGTKIREYRKSLGMTATSLAEKVGVELATISKIENNKANPSMPTLYKIAEALNTTPSKLLDGVEQPIIQKEVV